MAMNMDAAIRIKANIQGTNAIQAFSRDLKNLDGAAKLSGVELGRMNIAINRMAREAGNTTVGLRQHIAALSNLRDRVEIGGKAYNRLGNEINQLRGKLRALDKDAEKTGSTLKDKLIGGLGALGVGRVTGGIIRTAANFDAELRRAAAIEGGGNFDQLRKDIERVAAAAAGTPTEVAQLATALSRAGFTAKETGESLQGIVRGAEATSISFEEMGSIAADSMRAFGIETSKTQQVVDILVKSANSSNQTVLDLGESLKYAAPIARSLGVNINDLAATMAILANNGIRGSEAGTALRTGLQRLQIAASGNNDELLGLTKGSALLSKAMKILGADVLTANGQLKPLDEVLLSLKKNLATMPVGVQAEVVKALFGDEAGGKLRAALNSTDADIRKMFETIRNSGGAAAQTQKEMQGFAFSLSVLGGNVEIVSTAIGEKFAAVLKPLVDGLSAAIGLTQTWPQPLKDVAAAAAAAGIATGGLVLAFKGLAAIGITSLLTGIVGKAGALALALKSLSLAALAAKLKIIALNAVLLVNPWFALAAGITAAAVALAGYKRQNDKVIASMAGGDPAQLAAGRTRLTMLDAQILQKEQSIRGKGGPRAASNQRQLNQLRKDRADLARGITEGGRASRANVIESPTVPSGTIDLGGDGADGGKSKIKKAADEAKQAIDQYNSAVKSGSDATRTLMERLQDVKLNLIGIGVNAADALGLQRLKVELAAAREYGEEMRKIGELEKQRAAASAKGINTIDLDTRIAAAEELAEALRKARSVEGFEIYTQGLIDLLPKEADYNRQIKEGALLLENKKKGIEGLSEVQKLNLQIELLNLEALAVGNPALAEQIRLLREKAQILDDTNKKQDKTFGESFKGKIKEYVGSVQDLGSALGNIAVNSLQNLEDALFEFVTTGKLRFKEFVASVLSELAKLAIKMAIVNTIKAIFPGLTAAAKGGVFENIQALPNANGNAFANGIVPYAKGGIVNSPTLFKFAKGGAMQTGIMGEAGAEAVMPLKRGPDGKLGVAATGGGGVNVVVNVDAKGSAVQGDQGQGNELGRVIAGAVQAELIKQQRPGGLLTR